jgi:hypothetical protein
VKKIEIDEGYRPLLVNDLTDELFKNREIDVDEEYEYFEHYDDNYYKIPKFLNVKDIMMLSTKSPAAVLTINRSRNQLPLKDIAIIMNNNKSGGDTANNDLFKIGVSRVPNPLDYTYLPEIIDTYPVDDHLSPGIAMFCFPNGIHFKKAHELPKWYSFVLTDEMGNRSYASCLIFTEEVQQSIYATVKNY